MILKKDLQEVFANYGFDASSYVNIKQIKIGHINSTYTLYFDQGSSVKRYLLQEINTHVFKNPIQLMENIEKITTFLSEKVRLSGAKNYENLSLRVIHTLDHHSYMISSKNHFFRVYNFIENAKTYQKTNDLKLFYNAGKTVGTFQNMLSDFDASQLHETIPNFHNTPYRFQTFLKVLKENPCDRAKDCEEEIQFVLHLKDFTPVITSLIEQKLIPIKVTHNDTKLNNIMFDCETKEGLCLVDLDTVMPGTILYDFGDAIRSGCNRADEDEKNLEKVRFSVDLFKAFSEGYLSSVASSITECEVNHLVDSAILMTFECGMRFLTDYLDGDHYFKTKYDNHNLVRCRTQFHLVKQMIEQKDVLEEIVQEAYKKERNWK
ncbi:MAG TPA: phosphotransferase [Candidatus Caccosoma faecigallinarum]|uniref:Phosphotransferase n=1 Tax=Candidatus Caccosoma faecigallinarum TaxID=2840720 RepID=A0A9D1KA49_9FIRM|nr:phosphotransferase [Candidatus Caccosoma faecigallinarum]